MSKSVFVLSRCMSCELLLPSKCVLFTCNDDFIVCFENLPSKKSSKVSTARRKILSPEEHKKKYFDHLVAILNDNEEKYGDTGHSCICKTAGNFHAWLTWDQALFSFRFANYIPAGKAKRKENLIQTFNEMCAAHFFDWLTFAESANQNYFRCLFF